MSITVKLFLGFLKIKGNDEPFKFGVPIVDLTTGLNLTIGIIAALFQRNFSDQG